MEEVVIILCFLALFDMARCAFKLLNYMRTMRIDRIWLDDTASTLYAIATLQGAERLATW